METPAVALATLQAAQAFGQDIGRFDATDIDGRGTEMKRAFVHNFVLAVACAAVTLVPSADSISDDHILDATEAIAVRADQIELEHCTAGNPDEEQDSTFEDAQPWLEPSSPPVVELQTPCRSQSWVEYRQVFGTCGTCPFRKRTLRNQERTCRKSPYLNPPCVKQCDPWVTKSSSCVWCSSPS